MKTSGGKREEERKMKHAFGEMKKEREREKSEKQAVRVIGKEAKSR